ncbi:hypothetical protein Ctob_006679 [Chrysochromulina tobinii]|uniref:Uncharacterized protein n=1 Tax=Chrysochromulina tobinii TaxID=1460289 RepID=A0A0M0JE82_9EUKA|nr:hypothetical protein Ctob_006679 [Chrysochromulina tobinii]|eukprot:KOO24909.1 hypothetical protein Ctob_006679 [Chrysochromulina sp. CCMP291]
MMMLTSVESLTHSEDSLRPVVRRPSTASGAARLHGSRSASILLETEQGGAASSQPVSRPSTATLPHLAKGAPSRDPTVVLLRQRNRQLEADIGAMEAHYRAQLQAYADSSRMFGFSRPPDKLVAYWAEAQLLLNRAIAEQYGSGRDADAEPGSSQLAAHRLSQQLSAAELRAVRTRYEYQVEHARSELVQAKAELHSAHAELRAGEQKEKAAQAVAQATALETKLKEVGNRLRAPATALAFSFWARERESAQHNARLHALLEQQRALEVALSAAREGAQAEASQLVAEASLQASTIESRYERQLAEAKAAAEALQALQDAKAKHERIELLHRQADRIALLRQSETLEAKLSLAHYELGQLALHKAAQDDELGGLRKRCAELSEEAKEHAALVIEAATAKSELAELQVMASDGF